MNGTTSRYLIDERPLTVQPTLIKVFGIEQAIILQQFHWLIGQPRTGIEHEGMHWIWGSYEQWCDDYFPFWLPRTLRYHINKLQKAGVIITKALRQVDWDRTNYYTIDYTKLDASIRQHLALSKGQPDDASKGQPDDASIGQSVAPSLYRTEKTTEKTTEKARAEPPPPTQPPATPKSETATATSTAEKPRMGSEDYDHPAVKAKATPPSSGRPSPTSPHIDGRKWKKGGGYIITGLGETPVEVWYESFSIKDSATRLTEPDEDDLKHCLDLTRFREVVATFRRCNFPNKKNIQLILEWYRDGIPPRYTQKGAITNGANYSRGGAQRPNQPVAPESYTAPAIKFYHNPDDPF